jgi:hypothetical protein
MSLLQSCQKHRSRQLHFAAPLRLALRPTPRNPTPLGPSGSALHGAGHLCRPARSGSLPAGNAAARAPVLFQRGTETPRTRCAARLPNSAEQAVLSTGARQYAARVTKVDQANTRPAMGPKHRGRWAPGAAGQLGAARRAERRHVPATQQCGRPLAGMRGARARGRRGARAGA